MYGYFDESIIQIDGKRIIFVAGIFYKNKPNTNLIFKEFYKTRSTLKFKNEIKFSNVRNVKIRDRIIKNILAETEFYNVSAKIISESIHDCINECIIEILTKYNLNFHNQPLSISYDRSSYLINKEDLFSKFNFIKKFEMVNSLNHTGIQHADWVAGDASSNFKQFL